MEYIIKNGQMRVYGCGGGLEYNKEKGGWDRFCVLCRVDKPIGIYATSNIEEDDNKECARGIKGAKLLYSWEEDKFIDDNYNKRIKVGKIQCEAWDFREVLGCEKSIEECVDYETREFLKINGII